MEFINVQSSQWRYDAADALEQGAISRSPVIMTRAGKAAFIVFPIPPMSRPSLNAEVQRLAIIATSHTGIDVRSPATEPVPHVKVSDFRRYMLETLQKIIFDGRPHILNKYGVPAGLLLPIPRKTEEETVGAIAEEFYQ